MAKELAIKNRMGEASGISFPEFCTKPAAHFH